MLDILVKIKRYRGRWYKQIVRDVPDVVYDPKPLHTYNLSCLSLFNIFLTSSGLVKNHFLSQATELAKLLLLFQHRYHGYIDIIFYNWRCGYLLLALQYLLYNYDTCRKWGEIGKPQFKWKKRGIKKLRHLLMLTGKDYLENLHYSCANLDPKRWCNAGFGLRHFKSLKELKS